MAEHIPDTVPDDVREQLTFDRTLPRQLVHKHAIETVVVTDALQVDDARFWVAGMFPRAAALFSDASSRTFSRYDLSLLVEVSRQMGLVVTHRWLGSPETDATILDRLEMEVLDPVVLGPMEAPVEAFGYIDILERQTRRGRLQRADGTTTIYFDGMPRVHSRSWYTTVSKDKYQAARAHARDNLPPAPQGEPEPPAPADPALVGRTTPANVLIGEPDQADGVWRAPVHIDTTHPVFFEHRIGHVPGIVTSESLRQAALAATALAHPELDIARSFVRALAFEFSGWGELDYPLEARCRIAAPRPAADDRVVVPLEVSLVQLDAELVAGTVDVELCPRD